MIHSFLIIGQSNMGGRGLLNEALEINSSRIKILRNGRWQPMFRPINPDRAFSGTNLAESFAEKYAQKYDVDTGIICCADGGTSLDQWKPGSLLLDNAIFNCKLAQRTSTIAGVLWHQGENEASSGMYPQYREKFEIIMNTLRKELNLYDVPFLLGGLGDFLPHCIYGDAFKDYQKVNEQLIEVAKHNKMTGYVSSEGLTANADNLHFNAKSLYQFGIRYFEVFETLRDPNKIFIEKPCEDNALRSELEKL